jgi:hypothetical protein
MKRVFAVACALAVCGLVASEAQAGPIVLTPGATTCTTMTNSNFNGDQVLAQVQGCFGAPATPLTLYYKAEVGGGADAGVLGASYNTAFTNSSHDPSDALLSYFGGVAITCPSCYLVVKGGKHTPAQYFFNLGSWNGTDSLQLLGFWPAKGAISNIAIWGAPSATIPEPGTVLLFGTALVGLWSRNRRRARA